jgi:hypothetical protein
MCLYTKVKAIARYIKVTIKVSYIYLYSKVKAIEKLNI